MKNNLIAFGMLAIFGLAACTSSEKKEEKKEEKSEVPPTPVPAEEKDGTTIKMDNSGVSIENKDGKSNNNVNITKDSAKVDISRPK